MMWLVITLVVAFKIWMLWDAKQNFRENYWYFIIILPLGAVLYFFKYKFKELNFSDLISSDDSGIPCSTCRYKVTIYDDRIKCGYSNPPIMKSYVNVSYCLNYQRR